MSLVDDRAEAQAYEEELAADAVKRLSCSVEVGQFWRYADDRLYRVLKADGRNWLMARLDGGRMVSAPELFAADAISPNGKPTWRFQDAQGYDPAWDRP